MGYRISLDGLGSADLDKVIHAVEGHLSGKAVVALADEVQAAASTVCPPHMNCGNTGDSTKGGHAFFIVIVVAAVAGAIAGYIAGACATRRSLRRSTKGGHSFN